MKSRLTLGIMYYCIGRELCATRVTTRAAWPTVSHNCEIGSIVRDIPRLWIGWGGIMLAQAVNRTSGRSGSASEDDPAERGCSRSRTTLGIRGVSRNALYKCTIRTCFTYFQRQRRLEDRTWPQVLEGATTRGRSSVPLTDWHRIIWSWCTGRWRVGCYRSLA